MRKAALCFFVSPLALSTRATLTTWVSRVRPTPPSWRFPVAKQPDFACTVLYCTAHTIKIIQASRKGGSDVRKSNEWHGPENWKAGQGKGKLVHQPQLASMMLGEKF